MSDTEIMIVDERTLKDKIHVIRGQQVMLDFDLAEIYGYTTKAFNQQVKRNIDRFPDDFMFKLTKEEAAELLRSQNVTLEVGAYSKYSPNAFTEQGVYMLMTVLKGPLAVVQSKQLIRIFKKMKDYIADSPWLAFNQQLLTIASQTAENTMAIKRIEGSMVTHDELTDFIRLFDKGLKDEEYLILNGQPFKADVAYQKIYSSAGKTIIVIDDYLSVKTLQHLVHAKPGVKLTIISDNKPKLLKLSEYNDFLAEYPDKTIEFIRSQRRAHDRYIVIDNNSDGMKIYHCGASSKDAGKRITTISRLMDTDVLRSVIDELLANPCLILK